MPRDGVEVVSWVRSGAVVVMSSDARFAGASPTCCCPHACGGLSAPPGAVVPLPGPRTASRPYSERMPVRVVFCDDSFLVREGVAGLLTETPEVELVATATNPVELHAAVAGAPPRRGAHRHPDAPHLHHRGDRRGQADPRRVPRDRRARALAVHRGGVRLRPALRRRRGPRLPAEGAGQPGRRAGRCAAGRGPRRLGPGPEGRRGPDGSQDEPGELAPARPHRAGARGAGGAGGRPQQRRDRAAPCS